MPNFTIEIIAPELVAVVSKLADAILSRASTVSQATDNLKQAKQPDLKPLPQTFPQMAAQQSVIPAPIQQYPYSAPVALDTGAHSGKPAYAPPAALYPPQQQQYQSAPVNPTQTAPTYPNQMMGAANMVPAAAPAPVQPAPTGFPSNQAPVTAAPAYSIEQISIAAAPLMDAGKGPDLVNLLHGFGVQAVNQLPKEALGAFATELRKLGAKI